ncbi:MAG: cupredoxin domain-containing protein [Thermoleophilaceae bacterium]
MRSGPTRLVTPVAAVAALALAAAGCGGGNDNKSSSSNSSSPKTTASTPATGGGGASAGLTENATDFKFSQPKASVKSGTVTVTLDNKGQTAHAIVVEGKGGEHKSSTIGPGQTTTLKAKLAPGKYRFYCPVDGHQKLGMKGQLTVK